MTILSGVKLKLYPNKAQKQIIEQTFGSNRFVWNQFRSMQENRYEAMIDGYNQYKEQAKENGDKNFMNQDCLTVFVSSLTSHILKTWSNVSTT